MFSLKKLFGQQVKVTIDVSSPKEQPFEWYEEIVGKRGMIYPQSLDNNTVCVSLTPRIGKKVFTLFGTKAVFKRQADDVIEFIIPVDLVKSVFRYLKPKKRRQLTDEQKAVLTARLKALPTAVA